MSWDPSDNTDSSATNDSHLQKPDYLGGLAGSAVHVTPPENVPSGDLENPPDSVCQPLSRDMFQKMRIVFHVRTNKVAPTPGNQSLMAQPVDLYELHAAVSSLGGSQVVRLSIVRRQACN